MATSKNKVFESTFSHAEASSRVRLCAEKKCKNPGIHRAPKSRGEKGVFLYFCSDHITAYNAKWNYYAGMSAEEVARENDIDLTWRRPRHLFGTGSKTQQKFWHANPYEAFTQGDVMPHTPHMPEEVRKAILAFGLEHSYTLVDLKKKYRVLAKRYHPDTGDGADKDGTLFNQTIKQYQVLLRFLKT